MTESVEIAADLNAPSIDFICVGAFVYFKGRDGKVRTLKIGTVEAKQFFARYATLLKSGPARSGKKSAPDLTPEAASGD